MGYHCLRIMVLTERKPSEILPHFSSEGLPGFEDSYYFNARWYDPETGGFITEDPVKDASLWYAYVSNNPLKFVDPTGLRESEHGNQYDDEERERERREKDRKVKDHFKYMDDYDLTDEERDNYSQLADKQNEIDSARGRNKRRLQKEYTEMLTGMLHKQQDEGMSPDGYVEGSETKGGACLYRSIQAGVEVLTGKPMPIDMINKSTQDLADTALLDIDDGDYYVYDHSSIAEDAWAKLGFDTPITATRELPDLGPLMISNGFNSKKPIGSFTIRERAGHFNLGDHNGNFVWDPYYGVADGIPTPTNNRRMTVERK